ncbi:hypothetical protein AB4Z09_28655, partial [Rhodococcus sp. TAF43]|uniref:hypothetical protein n=1 Tax=Rhodococcus sp. TAF43 TaxID=3237483 RepID=UPI003F9C3B2A
EHHHSGPWTPTQPDRVGHPATSGNRNHHRDKKSELDQAGTPRSRKIEAKAPLITQMWMGRMPMPADRGRVCAQWQVLDVGRNDLIVMLTHEEDGMRVCRSGLGLY